MFFKDKKIKPCKKNPKTEAETMGQIADILLENFRKKENQGDSCSNHKSSVETHFPLDAHEHSHPESGHEVNHARDANQSDLGIIYLKSDEVNCATNDKAHDRKDPEPEVVVKEDRKSGKKDGVTS